MTAGKTNLPAMLLMIDQLMVAVPLVSEHWDDNLILQSKAAWLASDRFGRCGPQASDRNGSKCQ